MVYNRDLRSAGPRGPRGPRLGPTGSGSKFENDQVKNPTTVFLQRFQEIFGSGVLPLNPKNMNLISIRFLSSGPKGTTNRFQNNRCPLSQRL